ncbi:MAG: N(4)-(beta-N-acetylglucosaminyl)-L-asparaginase [Planctomycetaceae bacterium]
MPVSQLPRRSFLAAAAGSLAAVRFAAYAGPSTGEAQPRPDDERPPMPQRFPIKAIASANGLEATRRACELIRNGGDPLDAVIAGVGLVEDDPDDLTVGYGGLPNEDGVVELDAAVMHGPTHRAGGVASLQKIRHPAQVAKLVMERTDHVLLVGEGALRFARAHGFKEENLLSEKARKIWLYWKQSHSDRDDWLHPPADEVDPDVAKFFKLDQAAPKENAQPEAQQPNGAKPAPNQGAARSARGDKFDRPTGTIHCAAMNAAGDVSCVTTTSGLAFKIPGRVGDSPIIGAGLYCDNAIGSCGSTGRGEANLQELSSFAAVESMRGGMSPKDAGMEVLRRIAAHAEPRLRDEDGRPSFNVRFYLLGKDGTHAGVAMWGPLEFAVTDDQGARLEQGDFLYERRE